MTTARGPQRADGWTAAVRQRLGLGRLLPLGDAADGAWIAETAAASVLRGAVTGPGTVLGRLRIGPVEAAAPGFPVVAPGTAVPPAPPSALPRGPLRIEAEFAAAPDRPLPAAAAALRTALVTAASARLGMEVAEVDLRVTALLDGGAPDQVREAVARFPAAPPEGPEGAAAAGVPGVVSLTEVLGGAVLTAEDHVRVEVATAGDHRALDVARSVRTAVSAAVAGRLPVSVLVTEVVERDSGGGAGLSR
ncbi:hypothetical protein ACIP6P_05690 [Streptomyces sp. NPDC088729]|uniref:hypothetical protein n=1 Tax=Streptomyces sp. NPDC088729 TaxID=3365876 RepID=UPI00381A5077